MSPEQIAYRLKQDKPDQAVSYTERHGYGKRLLQSHVEGIFELSDAHGMLPVKRASVG